MNIAIIQLDVQINKENINLNKASKMINEAANNGAELICLPEAFATTVNLAKIDTISESLDGDIVDSLISLALDNNIYICAGFVENYNNKYYSSAIFINPNGEILGIYRKRILDFMEKNFLSVGDEQVIIHLPMGDIGILISNDITNPIYSYYLNNDKRIKAIICLASFPISKQYSIMQILKTRAIENHSYIIFASQVGYNIYSNITYMGSSCVIGDVNYFNNKSYNFEEGEEIMCSAIDNNEQIIYAHI